jgi:hypothetical protein
MRVAASCVRSGNADGSWRVAVQPSEGTKPMETLSEAIARLDRAGYRDSFRALPDGLLATSAGRLFAPEDLRIDETVRFEGVSDPEDEAVVFAIRSQDGGVRGTFVTSFGTHTDPRDGEMMRRLARAARRP